MGLPSMALKRPVMVLMFFAALIMLGFIALVRLPVELYQGQNQGIISIIVRARGGLAPIEVEKSITKPIEESIATVSNLKSLYSNSREAESRVTMEFQPGTDMRFAALEVREKFSRVKPLLPKEIEKPVIANYDDAESAILVFALTSEALSPEEIREVVEVDLKPILSRIDGVASVEVYGGRERKILIEIDRDKMVHYNVSVERIMDILGKSNVNLLAGNVSRETINLGVRSMGAFQTVEEIGELGIKATRQGSIIPLKELATVKDSYMEAADYARLNLEQNVTVYIKKTSTANTIPVARTVRNILEDYTKNSRGRLKSMIVSDKSDTIVKAIDDVRGSLLVGMFLVAIMIFAFLRRWELALIVLVSMPASVVMTFFFMNLWGISINVMTLSGMALAIGILVDSSIVIIENIFSKREQGLDSVHAVQSGAEEMWVPLLGSLMTTLVVFLPIIFIDKKIQMIYAGLAFTVSVSLVASFFLALMFVPIAIKQWGLGALDVNESSVHWFARVPKFYARIMKWNLAHRSWVLLALVGLLFVGGAGLMSRSIDWPATYEENEFAVVMFPLAGAKLEANDEAVKKVEDMLSKIPDVKMFSSTIRKDDVRIFVRLKPKNKRQYSKEEIIKLIDEQGNKMVKQVHDDYSLIVDEGVSGSEQKKLVINIFGNDNDVLQKLAIDAANRLKDIQGLQNIVMTDLRKRPEYSLVVDKGRAALYGINVRQVADSVHAQVRGMRPTKFHDYLKGEEIEVITRLQAIYRQKIDDLRFVPMNTDSGAQILLGDIANFYPSSGPQTIDRKDKYRYVFVKGDTKRPMEIIASEARKKLSAMQFPDDYYWRFGGSFDELVESKFELAGAVVLTFFLVYMVLACLFENLMQPVWLMTSVLFGTIGVWLALFLTGDPPIWKRLFEFCFKGQWNLLSTGTPLSQQVFIGLILLAGYVVNSAIIMVDHINHLKLEGKLPFEEIVVRAGQDRLRPIVMTTLSTVLGFVPLALGWSQSSELWRPLAVTIIGGLLSSTILTLFVLPNLLLLWEDVKRWISQWSFHRSMPFFKTVDK